MREKRKKHRGRNRSAASGRVQSGDLYEACFDDDDGVNSRGVVGEGSSVREGAWLVVDFEVEGGRSLTRTIEHCGEDPLQDTTLVEVFLRAHLSKCSAVPRPTLELRGVASEKWRQLQNRFQNQ